MTNKKGSEAGAWKEDFYETSEIKECENCEIEVQEVYSTKIIKDPNHHILSYG